MSHAILPAPVRAAPVMERDHETAAPFALSNRDMGPRPNTTGRDCGPHGAGSTCRRVRRVKLLLFIIVVLSVADLILTAAHLRLTGMIEANPIAAYVIRGTQSLWALALYKASTVSVCVLLLYRVRKHPQGEFAAWASTMILVLLCVYWRAYADDLEFDEHIRLAQLQAADHQWLRLGPPIAK